MGWACSGTWEICHLSTNFVGKGMGDLAELQYDARFLTPLMQTPDSRLWVKRQKSRPGSSDDLVTSMLRLADTLAPSLALALNMPSAG